MNSMSVEKQWLKLNVQVFTKDCFQYVFTYWCVWRYMHGCWYSKHNRMVCAVWRMYQTVTSVTYI